MLELLTTPDFTENLCSGRSLTEVMTFPDEGKVTEMEEALCDVTMDMDAVLQELKDDPFIRKYTDLVSRDLLQWSLVVNTNLSTDHAQARSVDVICRLVKLDFCRKHSRSLVAEWQKFKK